MISIVIRNKNEAKALENILYVITTQYADDYSEILIVDNYSTDNSVEIALKYNCTVLNIKDFTYGRAINVGIEAAKTKYVLLLSAHAIPVGKSFFKNTLEALADTENVAGIRYINSFENYKRAAKNNFTVFKPLENGLMAACALINKEVWEQFKFNEELDAIEDKEWSERVFNNGFQLLDLNETYFYFIKRSAKANISRYKNETVSEYFLAKKTFPGIMAILGSFFKKVIFTNTGNYFKLLHHDILILKAKFEIRKKLKKKVSN
ncbi:MAG: glycosyltransferase [Flavobacterium circumlabens]|uniref:glycosyltransferase family 2 protein n=1 Tax=Flavobacterium circumlabens TaxID=2133765 RepID=UPI003267DFC8